MGDTFGWVALSVAVVVLLGFYVSWRATRLDRLHTRFETAWAALDAALLRRCAVALDLAGSRFLDPATSLLLAAAAHEANIAGPDRRELAESDLSRALRAALDQPGQLDLDGRPDAEDHFADVRAAAQGVLIARRFYNDAVRVTRVQRDRWLPRTLHLAGSAPLPEFFEIDDAPPRPPE